MRIEIMEHHVSILRVLPPGGALEHLDYLQSVLPENYNFDPQQKRNMAARIELARQALERGEAVIITDDEPDFICKECPAFVACFSKPRKT